MDQPGINYHNGNATKQHSFCMLLFSPDFTKATQAHSHTFRDQSHHSQVCGFYVVGDFNNWTPSEAYKLYRDRDGWDGTTDADGDGIEAITGGLKSMDFNLVRIMCFSI